MKKYIVFSWLFILSVSFVLKAQTVYITKTGEKYHDGSCQYLSHSKIKIDLKEALDQGYVACKVCRPTQTINNGKDSSERQNDGAEINTNNHNVEAGQCTATTKKGARCKRMTKSPNGLCWQHRG